MAEKKLTGKIARERIRLMATPRPPEGIIDGYRALGDASGIVSDVMEAWHHRRHRRVGVETDDSRLFDRRAGAHGAQYRPARACL